MGEPNFGNERQQAVYDVALALSRGGQLPRPLYDRGVGILGDVGMTDLALLLGFYAAAAFTLGAYGVPADGGPNTQ
jgi:4-carboxymuconolactone decarboxylase